LIKITLAKRFPALKTKPQKGVISIKQRKFATYEIIGESFIYDKKKKKKIIIFL